MMQQMLLGTGEAPIVWSEYLINNTTTARTNAFDGSLTTYAQGPTYNMMTLRLKNNGTLPDQYLSGVIEVYMLRGGNVYTSTYNGAGGSYQAINFSAGSNQWTQVGSSSINNLYQMEFEYIPWQGGIGLQLAAIRVDGTILTDP